MRKHHWILRFLTVSVLMGLPLVSSAQVSSQSSTGDSPQGQVLMRAASGISQSQPATQAASLQTGASLVDSFDGFVRFPSEVNNRSFQFQQNGAYFRDFFTGGETTDIGVDGESISAQMVTADNPPQTIPFSPITFHANLSGQQDCWVGPQQTICNAPVLIVTWFVQTQCFTAGTFSMTFFHQGTPFSSSTFQIAPTIPTHTVPGDNSDPVPNDPGINYNQGAYSSVQYGRNIPGGDFCSFPRTVNGQTKNVVGHCDAVNHPTEKIMFISQLGCALTDATMVLGYFGMFTDPPTLNTYLANHGGYDDGGGVQWPVVQQYAADHNFPLGYNGTSQGGNTVRQPMCSKGPTIVPVQHTVLNPVTGKHVLHHHFVTAWGQVDDPASTFLLKDSNGGRGDLLSGTVEPFNYNNTYFGTREFQGPDQNFTFVTFNGRLTVKIHSPAELLITNSAGQRTGLDPVTNTSFNEIPGAAYFDDTITDLEDTSDDPAESDSKTLDLGAPAADTFTLTVTGTDVGTYSLELTSFDPSFQQTGTALQDIPTSPGAIQTFTFTTPIVTGQSFPLSGGFDGGGQRPRDVNHFLSYGNPTTDKVTLPTGTSTFPLLIFYGTQNVVGSFSAVLNGTDVSTLFNPTPGTFEVINIPLQAGSNVLKLSMDGNLGTRVATDTDRLVFDVQ